MTKKYYIKLFLLLTFIFISWVNYCNALEVPVSSWPHIPFAQDLDSTSTLPNYIAYFFAFGIYIAGIIAIISLAIAGIQLIMSAENPENRGQAIDRIKGAVIGLVLLFGAFIIIGTINPQLKTVTTEPLFQVGGVHVGVDGQLNNGPNQSADSYVDNLDNILKTYNTLYWPQTVHDSGGNTIQNCDASNPNAVIVVYLFGNYNDTNLKSVQRLKCGDQLAGAGLSGMKSYIWQKEQSGVYFYTTSDCTVPLGGDRSSLPLRYDSSSVDVQIPTIKSVRVVNGTDYNHGPFYGLAPFTDPDYQSSFTSLISSAHMHDFIKFDRTARTNGGTDDDNSSCLNIYDLGGGSGDSSFIIYKWAGWKDDGTLNSDVCKVTLYSGPAFTGGKHTINIGATGESGRVDETPPVCPVGVCYLGQLNQIPITYNPGDATEAEMNHCPNFDPTIGCLGSFQMTGNCLVIISDYPPTTTFLHAQAFPISPRITPTYQNLQNAAVYPRGMGTPQFYSEWIADNIGILDAPIWTIGRNPSILVIPLAENLAP